MSSRALLGLVSLFACTPDQPTSPPERFPDVRAVSEREPAGLDTAVKRDEPAAAIATPTPASDRSDPIEALAPNRGRDRGVPGPRSGGGTGCEGGARNVGEAWMVECNQCSCGDDGQVTCTAMACGSR